jgi:hypothetical protein
MLSCNELEKCLNNLALKYPLLDKKNKNKSIGYKFHPNLTVFVKQTMSDYDDKIRNSGRLVIHPLILIEIEELSKISGLKICEKYIQSSSYKFGNFPIFLWSNEKNDEPYGTSIDFKDIESFEYFFQILSKKFDL